MALWMSTSRMWFGWIQPHRFDPTESESDVTVLARSMPSAMTTERVLRVLFLAIRLLSATAWGGSSNRP